MLEYSEGWSDQFLKVHIDASSSVAEHCKEFFLMSVDHQHRQEANGECQEALDTLYRFLDGELTDERAAVIRRDLDDCSPCLEAYDFQAELRIVVAMKCRESLPESLIAKVTSALRACAAESSQHAPEPPSQLPGRKPPHE